MDLVFAYTVVSLLIFSILSTLILGFIAFRSLLKLREIHLKAIGALTPCTFKIFGQEEFFAVKAEDIETNNKTEIEEEMSFFSEEDLKERIQMLIQEDFKFPSKHRT